MNFWAFLLYGFSGWRAVFAQGWEKDSDIENSENDS